MKKFLTKRVFAVFAALFFAAQCVLAIEITDYITVTFDGSSRIRYEHINNNVLLGDSKDGHNFFRFRFSGGAAADFFSLFTAYGKLTTESRSYIYNSGGNAQYNIDEVVVDNLFISFPKLFGTTDIKFGRMDLPASEYGEGFLIADGTPLDGSRTMFFEVVKFRYNWPKSNIELMTIYNTEFDGFPVINSQNRRINDSRESAFIVYGRTHVSEKVYMEPYYIWKVEEATKGTPSLSNQGKYIDQKNSINTFGSYFKYDMKKLVLRAQAALQVGNYHREIGKAFGGYAYADFHLLNVFRPLSFGAAYLSGDDPDTKNVEAWDPLFARYPWVSEILATLYTKEAGVGYWTNLQLYRISSVFRPHERFIIDASYDFVFANERVRNTANNNIFGEGYNRGNLARLKVTYNISQHFSTYVLGEYFIPGDFYFDAAENASFLRVEFTAKI